MMRRLRSATARSELLALAKNTTGAASRIATALSAANAARCTSCEDELLFVGARSARRLRSAVHVLRRCAVTRKVEKREGCGPQRKYKYATRAIALMCAARSQRAGAPELRVYQCVYCKRWHLTKQVPRSELAI